MPCVRHFLPHPISYFHFLLQQGKLPTVLPPQIWILLVNAWFGAIPGLRWQLLPPPFSMPVVYTDAAPAGDSHFVVASCKPRVFATSAPAPRWVRSQQSAELYAIFHTLCQLLLRSYTHACIIVDNVASYYTVLSGRVSCGCFDLIRIIRRINRICAAATFQFQLALVRSKHNAADPFSRISEFGTVAAVTASCKTSRSLIVTRMSSAVKRFWWSSYHSSFHS